MLLHSVQNIISVSLLSKHTRQDYNFTCCLTRTWNYGYLSAGDRLQLIRIVAISTQGPTYPSLLTIPLTLDSVQFFSASLVCCRTDKCAEQNLLTT